MAHFPIFGPGFAPAQIKDVFLLILARVYEESDKKLCSAAHGLSKADLVTSLNRGSLCDANRASIGTRTCATSANAHRTADPRSRRGTAAGRRRPARLCRDVSRQTTSSTGRAGSAAEYSSGER